MTVNLMSFKKIFNETLFVLLSCSLVISLCTPIALAKDTYERDESHLGYLFVSGLGYTGLTVGGIGVIVGSLASVGSGGRGFNPGPMIALSGLAIAGLGGGLLSIGANGQKRFAYRKSLQRKLRTDIGSKNKARFNNKMKKIDTKSNRRTGGIFLMLTVVTLMVSMPEFIDGNCCAEDLPLLGLSAVPAAVSFYYFNRGSNDLNQAWITPTLSTERYVLNLGLTF